MTVQATHAITVPTSSSSSSARSPITTPSTLVIGLLGCMVVFCTALVEILLLGIGGSLLLAVV